MNPSRKRAAVEELESSFGVSERRACAVVDQPRSSQRYQRRMDNEEQPLVNRMVELARRQPRHGYRMIAGALRAEGWLVNRKRVYRLWRREGLKVPQIRRKRRRLGTSGNSCVRRRAERPNDVWAWDFVFDRTSNGRQLKWLSIVDEFTRECLCLSVGRRFTSLDVIDELVSLSGSRGLPQHIRSDNGPEFIATEIREWLRRLGVETLYVEPGSPWENGYAESFHSRLRDEFLSMEEFDSLSAARQLTAMWRDEYNHRRPHSSLGYRTPAGFATNWTASIPVAALPPFQQSNSIPVTQP